MKGYVIITSPDGVQEYDTLACPHCGGHFQIVPGSGRRRNFCLECYAPTCNGPRCVEHNPFAKRLDLVEAGKLPLSAL